MNRFASLVLCFFALPVAACDCSSPAGPCEGDGTIAGCGAACADTSECPVGLYCEGGACTADCTAGGGECSSRETCNAEGRCVATAMDGSADSRPPGDGAPLDNTCASVEVGVNVQVPRVMLIVDRSGSMDDDFDGDSRWNTLRDSLLDPASFINRRQSAIHFGLALYSNSRDVAGCPDIIFEPPQPDNYADIDALWNMYTPDGDTPTGESIDAVRAMLPAEVLGGPDPVVFVLATDGEPDTCADGDDTTNGRRLSVEAVTNAYGAGIQTYVISVGTGVAMAHLQDIANAGLGRMAGDPDAEFWVVTDTAGLEAAFDGIIGGIGSCDVALDGMLDPERACEGTVTLDGTPLACDDPNGWSATDESHIRLMGDACTEFLDGGGILRANFPCGVILI